MSEEIGAQIASCCLLTQASTKNHQVSVTAQGLTKI